MTFSHVLSRLRAKLFPAGSDATAARMATLRVGADQVSPPAGKSTSGPALLTNGDAIPGGAGGSSISKPRRRGLGPKQLKWLRSHIESFRDLEALTKASKDGTAPIGSKK